MLTKNEKEILKEAAKIISKIGDSENEHEIAEMVDSKTSYIEPAHILVYDGREGGWTAIEDLLNILAENA